MEADEAMTMLLDAMMMLKIERLMIVVGALMMRIPEPREMVVAVSLVAMMMCAG